MARGVFERLLRITLLVFLGLSLAMSPLAQAGTSSTVITSRPTIRLGMMAFLPEAQNQDFTTYIPIDDFVLSEFPRLLQSRLPQYQIETHIYRTADLVKAASSGDIDLVFCSSGCFASLIPDGIYPLATLTTKVAPDPNAAVAGALLVRVDRPFVHIEDLKGTRAMSGLNSMFFNWQLPVSALTDRGIDPKSFFAELTQVDNPVPRVLEALKRGDIDVGFIRACVLENLPPSVQKDFRVIDPMKNSPLACQHTSRVFPNWTVGGMQSLSSQAAQDVAVALLTLPPQTDQAIGWSIANRFQDLDTLYKTLHWGRYEYLSHWTFKRFWMIAWPYLLAGLVAFTALLWHLKRVNRLVDERTRALRNEVTQREALQNHLGTLKEKFHQLERISTLGMISNMVAHDIRQPLSALRYALRTIEQVTQKEASLPPVMTLSCERARRQTERINDIIENVCAYARNPKPRERLNLLALIRETVSEAYVLGAIKGKILCLGTVLGERTPVLSGDTSVVWVDVNALEIQLALINLLKNAQQEADRVSETTGEPPDAHLSITVETHQGFVTIEVADEVKTLSPETLAAMNGMLPVGEAIGRQNGRDFSATYHLGLGLSIVRGIVESHAGSLHFLANDPKGLKVRMVLPLAKVSESER